MTVSLCFLESETVSVNLRERFESDFDQAWSISLCWNCWSLVHRGLRFWNWTVIFPLLQCGMCWHCCLVASWQWGLYTCASFFVKACFDAGRDNDQWLKVWLVVFIQMRIFNSSISSFSSRRENPWLLCIVTLYGLANNPKTQKSPHFNRKDFCGTIDGEVHVGGSAYDRFVTFHCGGAVDINLQCWNYPSHWCDGTCFQCYDVFCCFWLIQRCRFSWGDTTRENRWFERVRAFPYVCLTAEVI